MTASKANYLHYVMLSLLAIVSIVGGQYCDSMSFTLLGLACTGLELTFLSSPKRGRQTRQSMRWPLIIGGSVLSIPGFLYVIAEIANSEPGSPRYPVSLAVCSMFAVGLTVWLILAVYSSLPHARMPKAALESQITSNSKSRAAAGIVLLVTLSSLSCALRAAAVFQPTKLVVHGFFPFQDRAYPYSKLVTVEPTTYSYSSGNETKSEPGVRLVFADGNFDLGPTWRWLCPRDKETVDNRIMALLQPHMANLMEKMQAGHSTPSGPIPASQTPIPKDYGINASLPIDEQIAQLSAYLKDHPDPFDSYGHNVLRHLYLAVDERKAMEQCDLIFAHSFMDEYTLQCLSDWMMDKHPDKAIKNLMLVSDKYQDLKFLHAACTLQIARLYKQLHKHPDASRFLALLVKDSDTELSAYRAAAEKPD